MHLCSHSCSPGAHQAAVQARVKQIRTMLESTELDYEREKLNERIARLAGGVAIIQARGFCRVLRAWQFCAGRVRSRPAACALCLGLASAVLGVRALRSHDLSRPAARVPCRVSQRC
jgi:hypothetical protein